MGVIIGSIIACSEFLGRDFLWEQITGEYDKIKYKHEGTKR